jgi:hypothetical protein
MTTDERAPLAVVPAETVDLVRDGKPFTVADLAARLAAPAAPAEVTPAKLPKPSRLPDTAQAALDRLPEVFNGFTLTETRPLTSDERRTLTEEAVRIAEILKPLKDRLDDIKVMIETHIDQTAPEGTPLIATGVHAGHALVATPGEPYEVRVPGFEEAWRQQYTKGDTHTSMARLKELEDEGKITREEFLSFTSVPDVPRQLDDAKIKKALRKDPGRALEILAAITVTGPPTASIVSPKK